MADDFVPRRELEVTLQGIREDIADLREHITVGQREIRDELRALNGQVKEHAQYIVERKAVELAADRFVNRLQWRVMAAIAAASVGVGIISAGLTIGTR